MKVPYLFEDDPRTDAYQRVCQSPQSFETNERIWFWLSIVGMVVTGILGFELGWMFHV